MTVFILTSDDDVHADAVCDVLSDRRVGYRRFDIGLFPRNMGALAKFGPDGTLAGYLQPHTRGGRSIDLDNVVCGWYRRPTAFQFSDTVLESDDLLRWATREARLGIGGILHCLPWLNHPADEARAEYKPWQLHMAAKAGLSVPRTIVTDVFSHVRTFDKEHGPLVHKHLSTVAAAGSTFETIAVESADLEANGRWVPVRQTANMFQQRVDKTCDVRLTVVDHDMFGVRIDSEHLDWRVDVEGADYSDVDVPAEVTVAVQDLMFRLRLRFGAFDFAVDRDGTWRFLEVNPSGAWLWLQERLRLPIAEAIADALCRDDDGWPDPRLMRSEVDAAT